MRSKNTHFFIKNPHISFWSFSFLITALILIIFSHQAESLTQTRTLKIFNTHTKERADITFKRNGRYDANGLKQMNRILRDWRNDQVKKMDPALFDLLWEVYQKVGAKKPIHVVSGYRSPKTNNMLRRRSKGVAKNSQHTKGKATDFFIPGVNSNKIRAVAMRIQTGGVGFYPRSNSKFVHLDTGRVRHWPRMTRKQLVRLFPKGQTVHVPSDGKPLKGYQIAKARIEARKNGQRRTLLASAAPLSRTINEERSPRLALFQRRSAPKPAPTTPPSIIETTKPSKQTPSPEAAPILALNKVTPPLASPLRQRPNQAPQYASNTPSQQLFNPALSKQIKAPLNLANITPAQRATISANKPAPFEAALKPSVTPPLPPVFTKTPQAQTAEAPPTLLAFVAPDKQITAPKKRIEQAFEAPATQAKELKNLPSITKTQTLSDEEIIAAFRKASHAKQPQRNQQILAKAPQLPFSVAPKARPASQKPLPLRPNYTGNIHQTSLKERQKINNTLSKTRSTQNQPEKTQQTMPIFKPVTTALTSSFQKGIGFKKTQSYRPKTVAQIGFQ